MGAEDAARAARDSSLDLELFAAVHTAGGKGRRPPALPEDRAPSAFLDRRKARAQGRGRAPERRLRSVEARNCPSSPASARPKGALLSASTARRR